MDESWLDLRDERKKKKKLLNEKIGKRLKILAEEKAMTNVEFGTAIGLLMDDKSKESTVTNIFNGKKELDIFTLIKISKKFEVSINWLLCKLPLETRNDKYLYLFKKKYLSEQAINDLSSLLKDHNLSILLEYLFSSNTFLEYLQSMNNYALVNFKETAKKLSCDFLSNKIAITNDDIEEFRETELSEEQKILILDKKNSCKEQKAFEKVFDFEETLDEGVLKLSKIVEELAREYAKEYTKEQISLYIEKFYDYDNKKKK